MIADKNWILKTYEEFNKKYFSGELPPISAKLSRAKSFLGRASAAYDNINKNTCDYVITISNYYDQPEDVMISTMLHEMIHIKDYYINGTEIYDLYWSQKRHRGHGSFFLKEAYRVSKESGIKITVTADKETIDRCELSEKTKQALSATYLMLISDSKEHHIGNSAFRLPKNATASDVSDMLRKFKLTHGYVVEGAFKLFAGKKGSLRTGRLINDNEYAELHINAEKISEKILADDKIHTVIEKIKNRK